MPIRLRLVLLVVGIAVALVVAGGVAIDASLRAGMRATIEDSLRRGAVRADHALASHRMQLAGDGQPAVPVSDQSTLQVVSSADRVVYTTTTAGRAALLSEAQLSAAFRRPRFVERSRSAWRYPDLLLAEAVQGHPGWILVVGRPLDELENATGRLQLALLMGGPLLIALVGAGAWFLAFQALNPVERLRAEAAAISRQGVARRLAVPGSRDEVARLAETLNSLLDGLHEVLAHQRRFVADASHELRTPLAAMQAQLETVRRLGRPDTEVRRSLDVLGLRLAQLVRMSEDLLLLARGDEGALGLQLSPQPLEPLVGAALQAVRPLADARGVALVLDAEPGASAVLDGMRFGQIIDNLVVNSVQHSPAHGAVEIRIRQMEGSVRVEVADQGPGFPEDLLPRAFDRFSTGSDAARPGRGVGLGLAVVHTLVAGHHGSVVACNPTGGGASVVVTLPSP